MALNAEVGFPSWQLRFMGILFWVPRCLNNYFESQRAVNARKENNGRTYYNAAAVHKTSKQLQEAIKAMDRDRLSTFLQAAENAKNNITRKYYPFFLLMARTGLRLGEALALEVSLRQACVPRIRASNTLPGHGEPAVS